MWPKHVARVYSRRDLKVQEIPIAPLALHFHQLGLTVTAPALQVDPVTQHELDTLAEYIQVMSQSELLVLVCCHALPGLSKVP